MKIIPASFTLLAYPPDLLELLELAGRVCYKSEDRITADSASGFVSRMKDSKHASVLEHGAITVKFICDRGVSHELVRHRIASFSQESTRYCNYSKSKFSKEITVIAPHFWGLDSPQYEAWKLQCELAEESYFHLLELGASPQEARSVLPTSLKTELIVTANPREWAHILELRCAKEAHPQMRELMIPLQQLFKLHWPEIF